MRRAPAAPATSRAPTEAMVIRQRTPQNSPMITNGPLAESDQEIYDRLRGKAVQLLRDIFTNDTSRFRGLRAAPQLPSEALSKLLAIDTSLALRIIESVRDETSQLLNQLFPSGDLSMSAVGARDTLDAFVTDVTTRVSYAQHVSVSGALRRGEKIEGVALESTPYVV